MSCAPLKGNKSSELRGHRPYLSCGSELGVPNYLAKPFVGGFNEGYVKSGTVVHGTCGCKASVAVETEGSMSDVGLKPLCGVPLCRNCLHQWYNLDASQIGDLRPSKTCSKCNI